MLIYLQKLSDMDITTIGILILIGLAAGFFGGMVGLGGGIIMIPAMIYFLGITQHQAQGTSLAVMLPPIGIMAVYNYYKIGAVNFKFALVIATTFIIGSYFGSKIAVDISTDTLKKIFGIAVILMGLKMLIGK